MYIHIYLSIYLYLYYIYSIWFKIQPKKPNEGLIHTCAYLGKAGRKVNNVPWYTLGQKQSANWAECGT